MATGGKNVGKRLPRARHRGAKQSRRAGPYDVLGSTRPCCRADRRLPMPTARVGSGVSLVCSLTRRTRIKQTSRRHTGRGPNETDMTQRQTLGAELRRYIADYPTELLRASHQTEVPHTATDAERNLVLQRWLELRDDIRNHITGRGCFGSFSLRVGKVQWNAEKGEQTAVDAIRAACWPVSMNQGLNHRSNPHYVGWRAMQLWALDEELLLSLRTTPHAFLDQPELWMDVNAVPCGE